MNKSIQLEIQLHFRKLNGQDVMNVFVPNKSLKDWCLSLQLLCDKLIDACVIHSPNVGEKLELICGMSSTFKKSGAKYSVYLTSRSLDCLRFYFLKYYRDGFAEVDHVDFEDEINQNGYLTFSVPDFSSGISNSEMQKMLDLK